MPQFNYTAMDAKGIEKEGSLEADSQGAAINQLREMGLFPTSVVEVATGRGSSRAEGGTVATKRAGGKKGMLNLNVSTLWGGTGVKTKELAIFTRQLATLVDAGLPLLRGLNVLQRQERNPAFKSIITELATQVESGSTFSEALFQHPKIFNKLYINMVKAGEAGGVLEVVLNRLSQFMEKAEKIKGKILSAMFYPVAVLVVALCILTFLMVFIVPKFEKIFDEMLSGAQLPYFTKFVFGVSRIMKDHFLIVLGIPIVAVIGINIWSRTPGGRLFLDRFKLNAPLVGDLTRKSAISRFTHTLGTLIASGVPILQALLIVKETSGNQLIANAVGKIHDSVKEGESIVQPLEASGVFPPMVVSMVDVGEATGALPDMLMKIAENYEEEVDNAITALVSLLEPIMIVFLAIIVGSIVIAMFLPLIKIIQTLGQSEL